MSNIELYEYNENGIKVDVPINEDTYINATKVYQTFGKSSSSFSDFIKGDLTEYAQKLIDKDRFPASGFSEAADYQVVISDVIKRKMGGNEKNVQGTWLHPELAIAFARWCNIDLAIWMDDKLKELLRTGTVSLQEAPVTNNKSLPVVGDYVKEIIADYRKMRTSTHIHVARPIRRFLKVVNTNTSEFDDSIKYISKSVDTQFRIEFYEKLKDVANTMFVSGELSMPIYTGMTQSIDKYHHWTTTRRTTVITKERNQALEQVKELLETVEYQQEKIDAYQKERKKAFVPKVNVVLRDGYARQDIVKAEQALRNEEGCEVLYAGTVFPAKRESKPDYTGALGQYTAVMFMNRDKPDWKPGLMLFKGMGTAQEKVIKSISLDEQEHLLIGKRIIGSFTYCVAFDEADGILLIYRQDNNV